MLDMEMARKTYQERIDSESYSDRNYTEEEKRLQREHRRELEEYRKNFLSVKISKVNSIQLFQWLDVIFVP